MRIGIFDSGIGGEAIAASLRLAFPSATFEIASDREHMPYGKRSLKEVSALTETAIQPLLKNNCDVIVIACNTATAASIELLRKRYPSQLFIGLEPMIKPAATLTKTNTIAVCATPATLSSTRYHRLKDQFTNNVHVLEPDCSEWAQMIEDNTINENQIKQVIENVCADGADVIVLACTHYHWIRDYIEQVTNNRATIIDPSDVIADRIQYLLQGR